MTKDNPLLSRRGTVQIGIESVYGTPAALTNNDGILVSEPEYEIDPSVLERDFVREDLSPLPVIIGRKLSRMTFSTEIRGNGKQHSGLLADAPLISRLFRACGYQLIACPDPQVIGVFEIGDHANQVTWEVSSGARATGTLTVSDVPDPNDTVTIGSTVYTFVAVPTLPYDVDIGGDAAISAQNLRHAINGTGTPGTHYGVGTQPHPDVVASGASGSVVVTANAYGTSGNAIATTAAGADLSWAGANLSTGANVATVTDVMAYYLEVTTGGASGAAQIAVTNGENDPDDDTAAATVTTASPFTVGSKGLTITPTFTGNLALGQRWVLWLTPTGLLLKPVSNNFESITIGMNKDGVYHSMPGSFGTFDIAAEAGNYATINWEFTGIYVAAVDQALPSPNYERTLPHQVELARLHMDEDYIIVANFTYDQANTITVRPDVSSPEGYIGTRITSRDPEGGIDPEAELVADHDFWSKMATAKRMPFCMRIGVETGNTVWFFAPVCQYTGLSYTDRDDILTYDAGLKFSRYNGNDEFLLFFA